MQMRRQRPFTHILSWLLIPALAGLLAGCGHRPERLLLKAEKAEKAAQAAQARGDVEAAKGAVDTAKEAVSQLRRLVEEDKLGRADLRRLLAKAQAAERSAEEFAALAGEERALREKLNSLKVRAYGKARTAILTTILPQMAVAAEKAGTLGTNRLSILEQPLAGQAWNLASLVSGRTLLPDGQPDWPGVASDLRNWSTNPPMEFRAFLGLALVLTGSGDFALAEFESVDAGSLRGTNALRIYHGGRALLCAMQGWNRLAAREAGAFSPYAEFSQGPVNGKQLLVLMHAFLAYGALKQREFERMDAEISQSLRAWPDNPLVVYLTGEKLAANGEWEKAAASLEAQAAGSRDAWLAKLLARRARDLRDGQGSAKALLLDGQFLTEVAAHFTLNTAKNSAAAKQLGTAVEEARAFGRELWRKAPLPGMAADAGTSESK